MRVGGATVGGANILELRPCTYYRLNLLFSQSSMLPTDRKDKLPDLRRRLQVRPPEWDPSNF